MEAFAKNATLSSEPGGEVVIDGKNVLRAGDTMSVSVDPKNSMMRGVEIATSYEEKPARFKGDFEPITSGPTYPARLVLEYPDKEVEWIPRQLQCDLSIRARLRCRATSRSTFLKCGTISGKCSPSSASHRFSY